MSQRINLTVARALAENALEQIQKANHIDKIDSSKLVDLMVKKYGTK